MKKSVKLGQTLLKSNVIKGEYVRTAAQPIQEVHKTKIQQGQQEGLSSKLRSQLDKKNILPFSYFLTDKLGRQHDYLRNLVEILKFFVNIYTLYIYLL